MAKMKLFAIVFAVNLTACVTTNKTQPNGDERPTEHTAAQVYEEVLSSHFSDDELSEIRAIILDEQVQNCLTQILRTGDMSAYRRFAIRVNQLSKTGCVKRFGDEKLMMEINNKFDQELQSITDSLPYLYPGDDEKFE